jgi:hypothetical protein
MPFEIAKEYERMIDLLNFVFVDIPYEMQTPVREGVISDKEYNSRKRIAENKINEVTARMNSDFHKCTLLLYYVILMSVEGYASYVIETVKDLIRLYTQFSNHLPAYNYSFKAEELFKSEDKTSTAKRKTNDNKSDCLEEFYSKVFDRASANIENNIENEEYIKTQKNVTDFLLEPGVDFDSFKAYDVFKNFAIEHIAMRRKYTNKAEAGIEFNRINNLFPLIELNESYESMKSEYIKRSDAIRESYESNPLGLEIIFEELNNDEVALLDYLYKLYKKHKNNDITAKEERQHWDILTSKERKSLADCIWALQKGDKIIRKYIRNIPSDMVSEYLLLLVAKIYDHPYYMACSKSKDIFRICQNAHNIMKTADEKGKKLYDALKFKLDETYGVYLKLENHLAKIEKEKSEDFSEMVSRTLSEAHKNSEKK